MDNKTREALETYSIIVNVLRNELITYTAKEQAAFDCLTEDLQKAEDGTVMYTVIKNMHKAVVCMDEAIEAMEMAKQ